jgi:hypothetical protein
MLPKVIQVKALDGYRIAVRFNDGVEGVIDLSNDIWGPVFEPLKDPAFFAQVYVDPEWGCVTWPNDLDLCPQSMYEDILTARGPQSTTSTAD